MFVLFFFCVFLLSISKVIGWGKLVFVIYICLIIGFFMNFVLIGVGVIYLFFVVLKMFFKWLVILM